MNISVKRKKKIAEQLAPLVFTKCDRFKKEVILKSLKKVQNDDSMPFSKSLICDIVFIISDVPFFLSIRFGYLYINKNGTFELFFIQAEFMQQE